MKKIYFLFLFCVFSQVLSAQNNGNVYDLAFDFKRGRTCGGGPGGCTTDQQSALRKGQTYQALGELWFDKYGRVMIELKKNSLNKELQKDIYKDGLFSLPNGWSIPDYILNQKRLIGVTEEILPGDYIVIEKERTVLIVLGKLH